MQTYDVYFPPHRLPSSVLILLSKKKNYYPIEYLRFENLIKEAIQYEMLNNPDDWF